PPRTPAPSSAPLSRPPGRGRALRTFVREPDAARRGCPEVRMRRLLVRTAFACVRMREQRRPPMPRARTLDPGTSFAACLGALLRHLRTLQGLTQAGLGAAAGVGGCHHGRGPVGGPGSPRPRGPRPTPGGRPGRPPPAWAPRPPTTPTPPGRRRAG